MPNQLPLIIERKGSVLIISLNNPEKRNALNSEMMGAAASAIANVGNYKELRSVVIPVSYTHLTLPTNREV